MYAGGEGLPPQSPQGPRDLWCRTQRKAACGQIVLKVLVQPLLAARERRSLLGLLPSGLLRPVSLYLLHPPPCTHCTIAPPALGPSMALLACSISTTLSSWHSRSVQVVPALWPPLHSYITHKPVIISTSYLCCSPHLPAIPSPTVLLKQHTSLLLQDHPSAH